MFIQYYIMNYSDSNELFPVVDEEGNEISSAPRRVCHDGKSKLLHPVVHLHLFNEKGELFLQKRAITKDLLPGYWDTSAGGHVSHGESIEEALKRDRFKGMELDFSRAFDRLYLNLGLCNAGANLYLGKRELTRLILADLREFSSGKPFEQELKDYIENCNASI